MFTGDRLLWFKSQNWLFHALESIFLYCLVCKKMNNFVSYLSYCRNWLSICVCVHVYIAARIVWSHSNRLVFATNMWGRRKMWTSDESKVLVGTGRMELLFPEMGTIEGEISSGENENKNADSGMLTVIIQRHGSECSE